MKLKIAILLILSVINCKSQDFPKKEPMAVFDIETFEKHKIDNEYNFILKDSTTVRQLEWEYEYEEIRKKKTSYFEIYKSFYKSGELKMLVERLPNRFVKYIKEYDEQGNLIKETDYDKGFDYTWEDLLKLLKKREVDIKDTDNTTIRKDEGEWWVYYVKGLYIYNIRIDGKTGKILLDDKDLFEEGS
ncbi:hypothetical protein [Aquimarina muelleri]|uniref:Uncharacterized protein n=1 Tax=Aquimarina muelleri TaxID=279356 RepID=A0A918JY50_9FLAO|nr:hypothetical protein [Aquimarina muelleri]MCX2764499.1 hypothetical protein [Aquimarina muelleri]GGX30769.1 hypothetical protein GCM10007384_34850 [Aquimarina muelleri]